MLRISSTPGRLSGFRPLAIAVSAILALSNAAPAQELAFSLGVRETDGNRDAELYVRRMEDERALGLSLVYGAAITDAGAVWAGVGLAGRIETSNGWFVGGSFMPGAYSRGDGPDLGHTLQFRTDVEAGIQLGRSSQISIGLDHTSNGGLGDSNPGSNSIFLRYSVGLR